MRVKLGSRPDDLNKFIELVYMSEIDPFVLVYNIEEFYRAFDSEFEEKHGGMTESVEEYLTVGSMGFAQGEETRYNRMLFLKNLVSKFESEGYYEESERRW